MRERERATERLGAHPANKSWQASRPVFAKSRYVRAMSSIPTNRHGDCVGERYVSVSVSVWVYRCKSDESAGRSSG